MNREIKIRLWYKEGYGEKMETGLTPNEWGNRLPSNVEQCAEIMLNTGLKDKKGIDIYEGDILRNDEGNLHVMGFRDGMFSNVKSKYNGHPWRDIFIGDTRYYPSHSEIIGNIHQNPELLQTP